MHEQVPNHTVWQSHRSQQGVNLRDSSVWHLPHSSITVCRGSGEDGAVAALVPFPSPPFLWAEELSASHEHSFKDLKH